MKDIRNARKNFVEKSEKGTILRTKCRPRSENVRRHYILGKMSPRINQFQRVISGGNLYSWKLSFRFQRRWGFLDQVKVK